MLSRFQFFSCFILSNDIKHIFEESILSIGFLPFQLLELPIMGHEKIIYHRRLFISMRSSSRGLLP